MAGLVLINQHLMSERLNLSHGPRLSEDYMEALSQLSVLVTSPTLDVSDYQVESQTLPLPSANPDKWLE